MCHHLPLAESCPEMHSGHQIIYYHLPISYKYVRLATYLYSALSSTNNRDLSTQPTIHLELKHSNLETTLQASSMDHQFHFTRV